MKVELYEMMSRSRLSRRRMLQGSVALGAMAALPMTARVASAQDNLRAQILAIPGVGQGSPTDAHWQQVGELCLGATKASVAAVAAFNLGHPLPHSGDPG